jgi:hypothetical protein
LATRMTISPYLSQMTILYLENKNKKSYMIERVR